MEAFLENKDNAKFHREQKALKRKENSQKRQPRKKKLEEKHIKLIKDYIDDENNKE